MLTLSFEGIIHTEEEVEQEETTRGSYCGHITRPYGITISARSVEKSSGYGVCKWVCVCKGFAIV